MLLFFIQNQSEEVISTVKCNDIYAQNHLEVTQKKPGGTHFIQKERRNTSALKKAGRNISAILEQM